MIPVEILRNPWIYFALLAETAVYVGTLSVTFLVKHEILIKTFERLSNWVAMVIFFTALLSLILAASCAF